LDFEFFIVKKIAFSGKKSFSAFIIRIAMVAVVLSVSTMIVAVSFVNGFQTEIRNKVFSFWGHIHILPYSLSRTYNEEGTYRYQSFVEKLRKDPSVAHIQPMVVKGGLIKTKDAFDKIVLRGINDEFNWKVFNTYLVKGQPIGGDSASRSKQIIISTTTAKRLKIDLNDKAVIYFPSNNNTTARAFRVSGIYETGIEEFDKDFAITDMGILQDINHWGKDTVTGFELFLTEKNLFKSRAKSYALLFGNSVIPEETYNQWLIDPIDDISKQMSYDIDNLSLEAISIKDLNPGLFDWLNLQTMNELIILILMILVAGINMITTLLILVMERTTMIGILKAIGANDFSIRKLFLFYGLTILIIGVLLGDFIGIGLCLLQQHFHFIQLPQESYYLKYAPIGLDWKAILAINIGTILLILSALLLPTHLAKRITPIKAIRFN
jgi:lipoprotein-releasing system permease protein